MEIAQEIIKYVIGVSLLMWLIGFTALRVHEVVTKMREDGEARPPAQEGDEEAPARGTFGYAQKRRKDDKADAPIWALLAAAKGLVTLPARLRRKPTDAQEGDEKTARERRRKEWRPFDEEMPDEERERLRREREQADDEGGPESTVHDDDEYTGWGPFRRRRYGDDEHHERREAPDITVEEVPRYGPRDPELERPIRALDPAAPEAAASEPEPVLADVIRIDTRERTPPVSTGTMVTSGGGGVAAVGDMNSHEIAMAAANAIVQANTVCVDGMGQVIAILNREIQVVSQKIDSLQANGITGSVLAKWLDQLAQLQVARNTAVQAKAQIDAAAELAASARANQAAKGNPVQAAVTSAGQANVADSTGYYGT